MNYNALLLLSNNVIENFQICNLLIKTKRKIIFY